jgi:hypothetical protein
VCNPLLFASGERRGWSLLYEFQTKLRSPQVLPAIRMGRFLRFGSFDLETVKHFSHFESRTPTETVLFPKTDFPITRGLLPLPGLTKSQAILSCPTLSKPQYRRNDQSGELTSCWKANAQPFPVVRTSRSA